MCICASLYQLMKSSALAGLGAIVKLNADELKRALEEFVAVIEVEQDVFAFIGIEKGILVHAGSFCTR